MLDDGVYEQVINTQMDEILESIPEECKAVGPIDKAEASKILAQYVMEVVRKGIK